MATAIAASTAAAPGDRAKVSGLSDIAFGSVTNLSADQRLSQSLCIFSSSLTGAYSVTAQGDGAGGEFSLASGSDSLPYEVQWADSANQSSGTALVAGTPLSGQISTATNQNCSPSPTTTASLTIVLRAAALSSAPSGTYAGTLTLVVAPN